MSKNISDLRDCLFATLEALSDKDNPMDLDRARAVSEVAQTIINTAKVEVEHMKLMGTPGTGFIPAPEDKTLRIVPPERLGFADQVKAANVTTHRLKG